MPTTPSDDNGVSNANEKNGADANDGSGDEKRDGMPTLQVNNLEQSSLGPEHRALQAQCKKLASNYSGAFRKGHFEQAATIGRELLSSAQAAFQANSFEYADAMVKLGAVLVEQGSFPEAVKYLKDGAAIVEQEKILGTQAYRLVFQASAKLGSVYLAHNNFGEARKHFEAALAAVDALAPRRAGTKDDLEIFKLHFADCLSECAEHGRAEKLYYELLNDLLVRHRSDEDRELYANNIFEAYDKIIGALISQHKTGAAREVIGEYRAFIERYAVMKTWDDADALLLLAQICIMDGEYSQSEAICSKLADGQDRRKNFISPKTEAMALILLGITVHLARNDYSAGITLIKKGMATLQESSERQGNIETTIAQVSSSTDPQDSLIGALFSIATQKTPMQTKLDATDPDQAVLAQAFGLLSRIYSDRAEILLSRDDLFQAERCLDSAEQLLVEVGQDETRFMADISERRAQLLEAQRKTDQANRARERAAAIRLIDQVRHPGREGLS